MHIYIHQHNQVLNRVLQLDAILGVVIGAFVVSTKFAFVRPEVFPYFSRWTDSIIGKLCVEALLEYLCP
jgi:hypothetical protein